VDGKWLGNTDDPNTPARVAEVYPNGGYRFCEGGPRCRGTIIAVHRPETVTALLPRNHPGHSSQKSHGRRKGSGVDGSTVISDADLTPSGSGNRMSQAEQKALHDRNAKDIAARWDASQADKDALMAADGSWFEREGSKMSPQQRNEAFVRSKLEHSESGMDIVAISGATAVADRLGVKYTLTDTHAGQVAYIRDRPELARATGSLGEASYANAQDWLSSRSIESVDLYRRSAPYDDKALFTSWSTSEGGTFNAPQHEGGRTLRHEAISSERIFSFTAAGFGSLEEAEFLVFNTS
jgi:hypothetical protein